jgi:serine/threonine-protein kinase
MPTSATQPRPAADRNLLFGILALQMDFINRDALIRAMNAWVLEKVKPLGQVLFEQGALSAEAREGLERIVELHLGAHGGDPERSLAAAGTPEPVRRELERLADPDLHASLAHVSAAMPGESVTRRDYPGSATPPVPNEAPDRTNAPSVGTPTSAGLRFRILRPHAEGGLGTVSVALDEELNREVALKEIRVECADEPQSRARFVQEAKITGGLDHPGVVPVYGLGCFPDGRPFYAMRLVQGASLQEAVKQFHAADVPGRDPGERGLALRGLLRRFVDVCNAVAYAHSRGVLHRDLKPANVMLGSFGETLVVDWGLAKPTGETVAEASSAQGPLRPGSASGSVPTQVGSAMGTPAYMSPEQAAGRLDELGPASDVYSLGATLYCLLTGQAPFTAPDMRAMLRAVQRGDFPPPRRVKPAAPAALEAVCLKAMALQPGGRYPTAKALADDVEHWLADEPVGAWREPPGVRARRWLGRHRTLVTSTAAAVLVAVAALAAAAALLTAANGRERQARRDAERNEREANELRAKEQEARQLADANGKAAGEQRDLALRTVKDVIFAIQTELRGQPKLHGLRQKLLQKAQGGLRRVARSAATAAQVDRNIEITHNEMGDIFVLLGDTKAAQAQYQEGHRIARQLAAAYPADAVAQRDLSASSHKVGDAALLLGDPRTARDAYEEALGILRNLAAADPANAVAQRDLSVAYNNKGNASLELGDARAARDAYQKGLEIARQLAEVSPASAQAWRDLSISYNKVGDAALRLGDAPAAREAYGKALEVVRRLAGAAPASAVARRDLYVSYNNVGNANLELGDARAARDAYQKGQEVARRLAEDDPTSAVAQRDLSISCNKVGNVALRLGDAPAALAAYREALRIRRRLAEGDPASAQAQTDLVVCHFKLGQCHQQELQFREAAACYGRALEALRRLEQAGKLQGQPRYAGWRTTFRQSLAFCQAAEQAIADLDFALKQPPPLVPLLLDVRVRALARAGRHADAAATADRLYERAPHDPKNLYNAACAYALCVTAVAPGKPPEQLSAEEKAARERYAARAVPALREAVGKGYKDAAHMKRDADLDPLRGRDDFKKLLAALEAKAQAAPE